MSICYIVVYFIDCLLKGMNLAVEIKTTQQCTVKDFLLWRRKVRVMIHVCTNSREIGLCIG